MEAHSASSVALMSIDKLLIRHTAVAALLKEKSLKGGEKKWNKARRIFHHLLVDRSSGDGDVARPAPHK